MADELELPENMSFSHLYECLQRNGYILPSPKSSFVTHKYLMKVIKNDLWVLREENYKFKQLFINNQPTKQELVEAIQLLTNV